MISNFEIVEEEFVDLGRVKSTLTGKKSKTEYEKFSLRHAKDFSELTIKQTEALLKELKALELRKLKDDLLYKIVELLPKDVEDLNVILASSKISFKKEETEKISEILKKYI